MLRLLGTGTNKQHNSLLFCFFYPQADIKHSYKE